MKRLHTRALTAAASLFVFGAFAAWLHAHRVSEVARVAARAPEPGTFRIYVLGGSTAAGVPYDSAFDLGSLTADLFGGEIAGRRVEVVRLAAVGKDTYTALADAREIAKFAHERGSAIAILYSGDNEFLSYTAHPDVTKIPRPMFDVPAVDREKREEILRAYGPKVEEIRRVLDGANVELFVCTGAINLADREPNRSVLDDPANEARVREILERAEEDLARGDREGSLDELRAAIALEPCFAWTRKRAGDVLRSLHRSAEARVEYEACTDCDGAPLTFMTPLNATLRAVARESRTPLVDFELEFRRAARDELPGYDLFWDHCHPTLEGFGIMAEAIARAIEARFHVERRVRSVDTGAIESKFHIDRAFMAKLLFGRGTTMYGIAVLTWNPKERLARSRLYLDRSLELEPNDANTLCAQAIVSLIERDTDASRGWWKRAFALDPKLARRRLANRDVGLLLKSQGVDDPRSMLE